MQCFSGVITSLLALNLPIEEVLGMGVFSTTLKYQPSHSGGQIGLGTALTVFMVTQYGNICPIITITLKPSMVEV